VAISITFLAVKMKTPQEIEFIKALGKECDFCGISSFSHLHRAGTYPKDFEYLEDNSVADPCFMTDHVPLWGGDGYFCVNCTMPFEPKK